jgi:pimeloyl-ACP methyl ester carboxylesterase
VARRLKAPVGFIAGTRSAEMRQGGLDATRRFIGPGRYREIEGSHLFPFERPEAAAQAVLNLLPDLG